MAMDSTGEIDRLMERIAQLREDLKAAETPAEKKAIQARIRELMAQVSSIKKAMAGKRKGPTMSDQYKMIDEAFE